MPNQAKSRLRTHMIWLLPVIIVVVLFMLILLAAEGYMGEFDYGIV